MPHRAKGHNRPRHHTHAIKPQNIAPTTKLPPLPKTIVLPATPVAVVAATAVVEPVSE